MTEPPTRPRLTFAKQPTSGAAKTVLGVLIAVAVIGALAIGSFVLPIFDRLGGFAFEPLDYTVRSARMKADQMARGDLEIIVKQLTPTLGPPTKRALLDVCGDMYAAWNLSNDITCTRSFYLYYPVAADAPIPSNLTEVLTTATSQFKHLPACSSIGVQGACEATGGSVGLHQVTTAPKKDEIYSFEGDVIEMDGFRELAFAAATGPYVVVLYTVQYFQG
jgi:hypothetical protein